MVKEKEHVTSKRELLMLGGSKERIMDLLQNAPLCFGSGAEKGALSIKPQFFRGKNVVVPKSGLRIERKLFFHFFSTLMVRLALDFLQMFLSKQINFGVYRY